MAENVKVAVRVRPFNEREKKRNAQLIIEMKGNTTIIKDPEKGATKDFAYDFSYWSHDGYKERKNGYLEPAGDKYADQQKVFDDLGKGVLTNSWKGYNCSLFAYGQTGSGKSYSMVGYGQNKGIVPMVCEDLFKGIESKRSNAVAGEEYQVSFSMLEIYSEQVRDLLSPETIHLKGGLKIREDPQKGFYVEQLKSVTVQSFTEITNQMNQGTKNRTVAATNMNETSSRAHTIVAIKFSQKSSASGKSMTKTSVMNLVDLAGSERADSTGAVGDRLKEGAAINQSLSSLGNVIKALADISLGKKGTKVPYRDSALTKLLKNALGGNSKTIMIAALSPADINYEETLSTLRFADRAKSIKTEAVINESPTDKLIRELKEENAKLLEMLKKGGLGGATSNPQEVEEMKKQMEEMMKKNHTEMEEMEKSWQSKMSEQQKELLAQIEAEKQKDEQKKSMPHFWNLNEDPSLTGMIAHFIPVGKTTVGINRQEPKPGIPLAGIGILKDHALIEHNKNGTVTIKPGKNARILLNGNQITDKKELHHNDRIMFGSSNLFVLHHPKDMAKQQADHQEVAQPTFETAQEEIAASQGMSQLMKVADGKSSKSDFLLQEDIVQLWPMISEANAMSEELDKKVMFEIALIAPQAIGKKKGRTEVCVKMKNLKNDTEFVLSKNDFINRKYIMQEMYQNYIDGDKDWDVPQDKDPFWEDPSSPVLFGTVHVFLQPLAFMVDLDENLQVTDYKGAEQGRLTIKMFPCDKSGKMIEDDYVENPKDLVGKEYHFKVLIPYARGLPKRFVKSQCKFKYYLDEEYTSTDEGRGLNPDFKFEKQFTVKSVTPGLVEYFQNEFLLIELWGRQAEIAGPDAGLNTKELMLKKNKNEQATTAQPEGELTEQHYKMAAEANTFKKRAERAEAKLAKIKELVEVAKKNKKGEIKWEEVDKLLSDVSEDTTSTGKGKKKVKS